MLHLFIFYKKEEENLEKNKYYLNIKGKVSKLKMCILYRNLLYFKGFQFLRKRYLTSHLRHDLTLKILLATPKYLIYLLLFFKK